MTADPRYLCGSLASCFLFVSRAWGALDKAAFCERSVCISVGITCCAGMFRDLLRSCLLSCAAAAAERRPDHSAAFGH